MIKRKHVVLSLLTLVSIMLGSLLYSSIVSAQNPTVTGYVSVSAAAFESQDSTKNVWISEYLRNNEGAETAHFYGAVQLPNGATVTNVTFYWKDLGVNNIACQLWRYNQTVRQQMAFAPSSGSAGEGSSYDDTINNATVDNSQHAYYLYVAIVGSATPSYYYLRYAIIEYTLPSEGAVGGYWIPVDKFSLLSPYIALTLTIILAISMSVAYVKYRKKQ